MKDLLWKSRCGCWEANPPPNYGSFRKSSRKENGGEKPYMDDDDEAGGASRKRPWTSAPNPRAKAAPCRDDDDGESAIAAADVVFAGGSWAPTAQTERTPATTPAPTIQTKCKSAVYWRAPSHARSQLRRRHQSET